MPVWQDDSLPHQIRLTFSGPYICLSCNCQRARTHRGQVVYPPIVPPRTRWEPAELIDAWHAWHAARDMPQPRAKPKTTWWTWKDR